MGNQPGDPEPAGGAGFARWRLADRVHGATAAPLALHPAATVDVEGDGIGW